MLILQILQEYLVELKKDLTSHLHLQIYAENKCKSFYAYYYNSAAIVASFPPHLAPVKDIVGPHP